MGSVRGIYSWRVGTCFYRGGSLGGRCDVGGGLILATTIVTTLSIISYGDGGAGDRKTSRSDLDCTKGSSLGSGSVILSSVTNACRNALPTTSYPKVGAMLALGTSDACRCSTSCLRHGSNRSRTDNVFGMLTGGMMRVAHPSDNRAACFGIGSTGDLVVASSLNARPRNTVTGRCILAGGGWTVRVWGRRPSRVGGTSFSTSKVQSKYFTL